MVANATRVLLIVHSPGNARVLGQAVQEIGAAPVHVDSEQGLHTHLAQSERAHAALVDVAGFSTTVWNLCRLLHENEIPFIVISPERDQLASSRSFEYGASTVLQKPVAKDAVLSLLRSLSGR